MSSKRVLVTRPEHDKVTNYLSNWAHEVIIYAKARGVDIVDLGSDKVKRKIFEEYMSSINPRLVFINGHGNRDCVCGHKDEIILQKDKNEKILAGKIVYALSCHSGAELGPAAIKNGNADAYIGYNAPFCFLTDKYRECTPDEDPLANVFKKASNQIPFSLIKGKSVEDAYKNSQNKFKELIRQYGVSDSSPEAAEIRFWLFWDMSSQVVHGKNEASL